jgi:hypothetical protein
MGTRSGAGLAAVPLDFALAPCRGRCYVRLSTRALREGISPQACSPPAQSFASISLLEFVTV